MSKKSLTLVLGLLVVGLLAASAVYAAKPRDGADFAARRWERLQKRLSLTPDQATRLQPIFASYVQDNMAARKANRDKFLAILTPDQKAQLEKARADRKAARAARKGQADEKGQRVCKPRVKLNLTDAQKAQMKDLRQSARAQAKTNREQFLAQAGTILTPDQVTSLTKMLNRHHSHRGHGRRGGHRDQGAEAAPSPAPAP